MPKARFHKSRYILVTILFLLASFTAYCVYITTHLTVTHYTMEAHAASPIRIVQLTDLHNAEFGEGNSRLVELVAAQQPDLIVMTGDMLNRDEERTDIVCNLISELSEIAPVYFGYGNHEKTWEANWGADLTEILPAAGATVLDSSYIDLDYNGTPMRIGGYMGYYRQPGMFGVSAEQRQFELDFADDFENTDRLKLLLNHIPTQWVDWNYIDSCSVDLVFSGHYHGGQMVIPFTEQGLYAPYMGLFPEHVKGVFVGEKATCVLSSGLGNEYIWLPRIHNPPEIVVVDLLPE